MLPSVLAAHHQRVWVVLDHLPPISYWEQAGGLGVEGQRGDIGETWLGVIHEPSRPFAGEPLTWKTDVTVDRAGATVQPGGSSWCSTP
jgi:hypothetical protein